jgi:hypothetical protein
MEPPALASSSVLDVAIAAMRLVTAASEASISVVKTAEGARLSVDLPFGV